MAKKETKSSGLTFIKTENTIGHIYTNAISLGGNLFDFELNMGIRGKELTAGNECELIATVFLSPTHAKALNILLGKRISAYEKSFGEIPVAEEVQAIQDEKPQND